MRVTNYHRTFYKGWRSIVYDRQIPAFLIATVMITALMTFFLWYQDGLTGTHSLWQGALNGLSALSTAGFSAMNISEMGNGAKLTLIIAMAVGGCAGSTAGGIKIIRLLIIFRLFFLILQRAGSPPQAVLDTRMGGKKLEKDEIFNAASLVVLFPSIILLSWLPFLAMGYEPLNSLFEVVSALGTAGISASVTSTEMPILLKGILCVDMLLGRLEIIAWLVFCYPRTWIGLRKEK